MPKNTKNRSDNSMKLHLLGAIAWFLMFFLFSHHAVNASSSGSFIQSYNSSTSLQEGMIVQLQKNNSATVEPATQTNILDTFGVVVDMANASIALEDNSQTNKQVFVANSGHYYILVSDQDGSILPGDYITLSPVDGIGMKDNSTEPIVVAQALGSFNGNSPVLGTDVVKTSTGNETIHLGVIEATIAIGHNPLLAPTNSGVPKVLEQFSKTITGKSVSAWRIWLSITVLVVVALIV